MPDRPVTRREMANGNMGVKMPDGNVGRLRQALDTPDLRANRWCFSPGTTARRLRNEMHAHDRGTEVVLILRGPADPGCGEAAVFRGGRVIDALVQHLDLYPTLCELIGADPPGDPDGAGTAASPRRPLTPPEPSTPRSCWWCR